MLAPIAGFNLITIIEWFNLKSLFYLSFGSLKGRILIKIAISFHISMYCDRFLLVLNQWTHIQMNGLHFIGSRFPHSIGPPFRHCILLLPLGNLLISNKITFSLSAIKSRMSFKIILSFQVFSILSDVERRDKHIIKLFPYLN